LVVTVLDETFCNKSRVRVLIDIVVGGQPLHSQRSQELISAARLSIQHAYLAEHCFLSRSEIQFRSPFTSVPCSGREHASRINDCTIETRRVDETQRFQLIKPVLDLLSGIIAKLGNQRGHQRWRRNKIKDPAVLKRKAGIRAFPSPLPRVAAPN